MKKNQAIMVVNAFAIQFLITIGFLLLKHLDPAGELWNKVWLRLEGPLLLFAVLPNRMRFLWMFLAASNLILYLALRVSS